MRAFYFFELNSIIRNKKNLAAIILLLITTLYYVFVIEPNYQPDERVDAVNVQQDYDEMSHWLENYRGEGTSSGAAFALSYFPPLVELNETRLDALEQKDFAAYTRATAEWYRYEDQWIFSSPEFLSYNTAYYGIGQQYPLQEGRYWYLSTATRYSAYVDKGTRITPAVLEERTALQTGIRAWNSSIVPIALISLVVIFSIDIVTKDRNHLSLVSSFPLSFEQKLWVKTAVVITTFSIVSFSIFLLGLSIVALKEGFGSFSIPVIVFNGPILLEENFYTISICLFYLQAIALILVIAYLFTRFIILCSLLLKNEYFNLLVGLAVIFTERLYYIRGIGYFSNVDLFPSTFFRMFLVSRFNRVRAII
ncbi:hypothetical protein [Marinilactibacillus sp. Marseille-P9653]|uniref:hypothetical protein n=1 Tax=Marinilactibacillus sp. Marseille-P9653 TaxID=2866583 RepID=UPI001CE41209|nr:hypothetical protein [Marinilactibacillus sp. Marseille-P9653]